MRCFFSVVVVSVVLAALPGVVRADVTIRYTTEMSSPMTPAANRTDSYVIYMKGNKGAAISADQTTIVNFARQQVTVIDTARRKYATVAAQEYGARLKAAMKSGVEQPVAQPEMVADMLKSMKTTCEKTDPNSAETIRGVKAEEHDVTCTMTMTMPDSVKDSMPAMNMKFAMRIWTAAPSERLRVPGLWQLSGFELWQDYFMNPAGATDEMVPDGVKPMIEALQKDQSATLRSSMEMSMKFPMPDVAAGDTPFFKASQEMVGLSTELLDDSLFSVPGDFSEEPFEAVMSGITDAAMASVKASQAKAAAAGPKPAIPENVKAYVPTLFPLTQTEAVAPMGADGNKLQGTVELLVTVGPKGNVEQAEALNGPEGLRQAATDAVRRWTFRPVIRDGAPVSAYTQENVNFIDFSKGPPDAALFQADVAGMTAAEERIRQLSEAFPRTPEQEFADVEQDSGGGDKSRRYARLGELALKAVELGANDKAKAYATELLTDAKDDASGWNYGNAVHNGHAVLGLLALRNDDVTAAGQQLLEAGKTPGSPQLNSFGPNMTLASELLQKGERDIVLDYFELCRKFWKMGGERLDSWSEAVRNGQMPAFGSNLHYY